jgi:predicted lipid-binding transport protein (Tim44 family)
MLKKNQLPKICQSFQWPYRALSLMNLVVFKANDLWARAGGGGGGSRGGGGRSSGGYGGGGIGYGNSYSSGHSSNGSGGDTFFFVMIFLVVIILISVYAFKRSNAGSGAGAGAGDDLLSNDPGAGLQSGAEIPLDGAQIYDIQSKAKAAFFLIQESWSNKNLKRMRRFISDGVYQRFNAQFAMMNLLDQTNMISDVRVLGILPVKYTEQGAYECIDIEIQATASDQFVSHKYSEFKSPGGTESFIEYWSFIRRRDCQRDKDIFHRDECPKCSGPITEKLMETARCPYCGVYINSGEFDWVLSEITQQEDYVAHEMALESEDRLSASLQAVHKKDPHFAKQILEDRASNAFLQVIIGISKKSLEHVQRFSTPSYFEKAKQYLNEKNIIYNRLYLNSVDLIAIEFVGEDLIQAQVQVTNSFQRVCIENETVSFIDPEIVTHRSQVILQHQLSALGSKGSIYGNACGVCGASQKDSLNATCEYCGSVLNDPKGDWIIQDIVF